MKKLFLFFILCVVGVVNIDCFANPKIQQRSQTTTTSKTQSQATATQRSRPPAAPIGNLRPEVKLLEAMSDAASATNDIDRAMVWAGVEWAFPANLKRQLRKLFVGYHYYDRLKLENFDVCGGIVKKKEAEIDRIEGFIKNWLDIFAIFSKFNHALEEINKRESLIFSDLLIWNNVPEECFFNSVKGTDPSCYDLIKKYNEKIKNARSELKAEVDSLKEHVITLQNRLQEMEKNYKDLFEDEKEILEKLGQFNDLKDYVNQQLNEIDLMMQRLNIKIGSYVCHPEYTTDPYSSDGKCLSLVKCMGDFIDDKVTGLCKCKDPNKKPGTKERDACE